MGLAYTALMLFIVLAFLYGLDEIAREPVVEIRWYLVSIGMLWFLYLMIFN